MVATRRNKRRAGGDGEDILHCKPGVVGSGTLHRPIVAAILGDPLAGVVAAAVLVLPVFVIFDTDAVGGPPR
jgi:hypothetical protein